MKKRTCLDCLYCKVSARSTTNCRLCFCERKEIQERHKENYWFGKKPCDDFEDMAGVKPFRNNFPFHFRRPLLSARTRNERYGYRFFK
jgi:hypothetical protein